VVPDNASDRGNCPDMLLSGNDCMSNPKSGFRCTLSSCWDGVFKPGVCRQLYCDASLLLENAVGLGSCLRNSLLLARAPFPSYLSWGESCFNTPDFELGADCTASVCVNGVLKPGKCTIPTGSRGSARAIASISHNHGNLPHVLQNYDRFGTGMSFLGDLDGDGFVEVAVGAPNDDDSGGKAGCIYILTLSNVGFVEQSHNIRFGQSGLRNWNMGASDWNFGFAMSTVDDIDGDGIVELMASAPLKSTLFLLFLNTDGTVREDVKIDFDGEGTIDPAADFFGCSLASLGDVNGDGHVEIAVG
jgi:hypothetical protein